MRRPRGFEPARPGAPRGSATWLRAGTRRGASPRRPAARSGYDGPLRAQEDGGAAGRDEAREDRGQDGDEQGEDDRDGWRRQDHEIRKTEDGSERDDRMRSHDPERRAKDRSREGEDQALRLIGAGHGGGRRAETPERRNLSRPRMDFEAHRRVHEQADDHRDNQGEQHERGLDFCNASADKPDRAERLEPREPEG